MRRTISFTIFGLILVTVAVFALVQIWLSNQKDVSVVLNRDYSRLVAEGISPVALQGTSTEAYAQFANGCFWCVEADLEKVEGVREVVSGYAGGTTANPTYESYSKEGHREVVFVTYDPKIVSYANLVEHILKHGDPTDSGGSFVDRGVEYSPAIYYKTEEEQNAAKDVIAAIDATGVYEKKVTIPVLQESTFYPAEAYHQDYAQNNPLKYRYYRTASGRSSFIEKHWGNDAPAFTVSEDPEVGTLMKNTMNTYTQESWKDFVKPSRDVLAGQLTPIQYKVTQEDGTEPSFKNEYDKNTAEGIYVDIVSGEPLYFSKDKYDSGTGWPSFVKPISDDVVILHEDKGFFTTRTEVRSKYADSHLGHVFDDGPVDRGGKRYCMNSAALRFIPKASMESEGYGYLLSEV